MPDLTLSQERLDFGTVLTGHARVIVLQLHNHRQVPCEWAIRMPIENSRNRDWGFFRWEGMGGAALGGE